MFLRCKSTRTRDLLTLAVRSGLCFTPSALAVLIDGLLDSDDGSSHIYTYIYMHITYACTRLLIHKKGELYTLYMLLCEIVCFEAMPPQQPMLESEL